MTAFMVLLHAGRCLARWAEFPAKSRGSPVPSPSSQLKVCEDDISGTSGGGWISADGTGTISYGAAASHADQRAAIGARVIIAVKDTLLNNGVEDHFITDILGRLAMAI